MPDLEEVWLPINRTRADIQETGICRALSRLPRLRRAFLKLRYSIGPGEELWNEEKDGEHPLMFTSEPHKISFVYLREAFSNSTIDPTLALSIFNLISSRCSLSYLRLEPSRKITTPSPPGNGQVQFHDLKLVELRLNHGADVNEVASTHEGITDLQLAAFISHLT